MRKLVLSIVSLSLFASMVVGCASTSPNSTWSPRDVNESTSALRQTPPR